MPALTRQIVKEALLVGVSYVGNDDLKKNGFEVQPGAHKDTRALRNLLIKRYGYKKEDITILIDSRDQPLESRPTKDNILNGMKKLIADKQAGDRIVFAFSGHGCQVKAAIEGDEEDDMDEILLPMDCTIDPDTEDKFVDFIRDNVIRDIFVNQLASGVHCSLIFDCCHSGTASDLPTVLVQSPVETPDSPFFTLSSPRPTTSTSRAPGSFARMNTIHDGHVESAPYMWPAARSYSQYMNMEVTSWSACLDDQVTYGRKSGGIFMKAFTQTLNLEPNPTHKDLLKELRKSIIRVTEEENRKQQALQNVPRGSVLLEDYAAPRPQLGSLHPDLVLLDTFTL